MAALYNIQNRIKTWNLIQNTGKDLTNSPHTIKTFSDCLAKTPAARDC